MSTLMSVAEREAFLADLHVGVVSVNDPGRGPLSTPVWYGYEPGGELWFVTGKDSRKSQLLGSGARVSLCVQNEQHPYQFVSVEGPVRVEPVDMERDALPLASRYLGEKASPRYIEWAFGDGSGSITIRMRPERWLTADYSSVPEAGVEDGD